MMEKIKSCRDCANFEDRRDIDKVAICALHNGPHVCCEEFKPRDESKNPDNLYNRFCAECANFEDINGIQVCAKIHTPGIACDGFKSRLKESSTIQQNNLMKTTLLEYTITHYNPKPTPAFVINIARKMKW
jgi:hypothetical protein